MVDGRDGDRVDDVGYCLQDSVDDTYDEDFDNYELLQEVALGPDFYESVDYVEDIDEVDDEEYDEIDEIENESVDELNGVSEEDVEKYEEREKVREKYLGILNFTDQRAQYLKLFPDNPPGNYDLVRRSLLQQVFDKLELIGISLSERQSVADFIIDLQKWDSIAVKRFDENMDVLLGSEVVDKQENNDSLVISAQSGALAGSLLEKLTSRQKTDFRSQAKYYYDLGLNVTCISDIKNEFNSGENCYYLKAPNHHWEDLWSRRQTIEEFNGYQWSFATGLGLATGFNNLLTIDIDDSSRTFLKQTLELLGLPIEYEWVVLSGSRRGFHIYVFVDGLLDAFPEVPVVRLIPKEAYADLAVKVELLIRLHSILPPSVHPTQNKYAFANCLRPIGLPVHVGVYKIQKYIDTYFDLAKQQNKETYKKSAHSKEPERQCPNKPHSWREMFFGCSYCIAEDERKRNEAARLLRAEKEEALANAEQRKQEIWASYVKLEKDIRAMPRYAVWRQDVLAKYGRRCAVGGPECTKDLEVDHFPRSLYSLVLMYGIQNAGIQAYECTALWDVNNGAVLCKFHHDQTKSSRYRQQHM